MICALTFRRGMAPASEMLLLTVLFLGTLQEHCDRWHPARANWCDLGTVCHVA